MNKGFPEGNPALQALRQTIPFRVPSCPSRFLSSANSEPSVLEPSAPIPVEGLLSVYSVYSVVNSGRIDPANGRPFVLLACSGKICRALAGKLKYARRR